MGANRTVREWGSYYMLMIDGRSPLCPDKLNVEKRHLHAQRQGQLLIRVLFDGG